MFFLKRNESRQRLFRLRHRRPLSLPSWLLGVLIIALTVAASFWFTISVHGYGDIATTMPESDLLEHRNLGRISNMTVKIPALMELKVSDLGNSKSGSADHGDEMKEKSGPYFDWELFALDFQEMMSSFKVYVYPDVSANESSSPFARIFLPHPNPFNPKLGNYFSEHMFKVALLRSLLITPNPEEADFYFMPFSINNLRNDPRVHSEASISDFVSQYTRKISQEFEFWNSSGGADHFFTCCHSVGREVTSKHRELQNNAIQVTCSSSYFQRLYVTHKDVGLPQVWPRPEEKVLNPPNERHRLVFFSGRIQNSRVRQQLIDLWGNDTHMDIFSQSPSFPYEEGFRRSKYCLHVIGYEVNTARISDAIHYGCIPVIISNYYDLPFANILDWSKFSVIINHGDIAFLKTRLQSISSQMYLGMYKNLCKVRKHFVWHTTPRGYDSFYLTVYQLWLKRGMHHLKSPLMHFSD